MTSAAMLRKPPGSDNFDLPRREEPCDFDDLRPPGPRLFSSKKRGASKAPTFESLLARLDEKACAPDGFEFPPPPIAFLGQRDGDDSSSFPHVFFDCSNSGSSNHLTGGRAAAPPTPHMFWSYANRADAKNEEEDAFAGLKPVPLTDMSWRQSSAKRG